MLPEPPTGLPSTFIQICPWYHRVPTPLPLVPTSDKAATFPGGVDDELVRAALPCSHKREPPKFSPLLQKTPFCCGAPPTGALMKM